jgi:N-sulfoglucosamine sulfohydrolase
VSHIDLFPTVCDLVGVRRPSWLQGESLLPLVNGEAEEVRDTLFAEKTYHVAYEPERCARTHRWKYIRRFDEEHPTPVLANIDDGPSKNVVLSNGWAQRPLPAEQLYDLLHDPNEANNLAGEPALESVREDMRAPRDLDARDRRSAPRRARPSPRWCRSERPGSALPLRPHHNRVRMSAHTQ